MSEESVAHEAREIARGVALKVEERDRLYDERHDALSSSIDEIKTMLIRIGGTVITMILAVLAWSLAQQYKANEAQNRALQEQIEVLQKVDQAKQ